MIIARRVITIIRKLRLVRSVVLELFHPKDQLRVVHVQSTHTRRLQVQDHVRAVQKDNNSQILDKLHA